MNLGSFAFSSPFPARHAWRPVPPPSSLSSSGAATRLGLRLSGACSCQGVGVQEAVVPVEISPLPQRTHAQVPKTIQARLALQTPKCVSGQIVHEAKGSYKLCPLPLVTPASFAILLFIFGFPSPRPGAFLPGEGKGRGVAACPPQSGP